MTLVIPTGFGLASFGGTIAGDAETIYITLGLDLDAAASNAMAEDLFTAWHGSLESTSSTDWTFTTCSLKEGPNATGGTFESAGTPFSGEVTETTVPCNTAVLVRKTTALGGRKGRGRMYAVGQLTNGNIGGAGLIDDTPLTAIDTAWFDFLGAVQAVAGVADVVLLHSDATTPTPITGLQPQKRAATQRRRLRP